MPLSGLVLTLPGNAALVDGQSHWLSPRGAAVLRALAERPGRVLSRAELLRAAWPDATADEHAVEAAVGRLRASLGPARGADPDGAQARLPAGGALMAPVLLAVAHGSRDPAAALADTDRMAQLLAVRLDRPVTPAHLSAASPTPHQAVTDLHSAGRPGVALATYLLSPGHFARRATATPASWTGAPLGPHPAVARLVLHRYDQALAASARPARSA